MIQKLLIQALLFPFSAIYGFGILLRNAFYKWGVLKEVTFNLPVIGVGNLTLGGAGKTPHIEYLIRLLSPYLRLATLSRGYKRKSKGFRIVRRGDNALDVGDEPLQYFLKYPLIQVAVSESRSIGIPLLLNQHPEIQAILLDDSYQHLSVKPDLNILLTEYDKPYSKDFLLPAGRLREWRYGADRADMVIVSKCPHSLSATEREELGHELDLKENQQLFFSKYAYGSLYHLINGQRFQLSEFDEVLLVTAIANETYLLRHIRASVDQIKTMIYEDHHIFNAHEVSLMKMTYDQMSSNKKAIVTTEKDATRLVLHRDFILQHNLPIYVLPLRVDFLDNDGPRFDKMVKNHLIGFRS